MEMVVTIGVKDMQCSSQIVNTNKPTHSFLEAGIPSCRPIST